MFEGNFKEKDQEEFRCDEGQSVSSFLAFLAFLYTGIYHQYHHHHHHRLNVYLLIPLGDEAIVQSDNAVELLGISDRLIVEDLKQLCEYFLERAVSSSYLTLIAETTLSGEETEEISDACENTIALLEVRSCYYVIVAKRKLTVYYVRSEINSTRSG